MTVVTIKMTINFIDKIKQSMYEQSLLVTGHFRQNYRRNVNLLTLCWVGYYYTIIIDIKHNNV